jgi:hypothetical protein
VVIARNRSCHPPKDVLSKAAATYWYSSPQIGKKCMVNGQSYLGAVVFDRDKPVALLGIAIITLWNMECLVSG